MNVKAKSNSEAKLMTFNLDTTDKSFIHWLATYIENKSSSELSLKFKIYVIALLCTYVPLLISASLGPFSIYKADDLVKLPFLLDWNVAFMVLVSFPVILLLIASDNRILSQALNNVQLDGVVVVLENNSSELKDKWEKKFRNINVWSQGVGVLIGIALAVLNYITYTPEYVGFWIAQHGDLLPVGWVFLCCIFLFYTIIPIYILRSIAISFLFRDLVKKSKISMLPFHPDKCGGLRPVGDLGLRNQYVLSILGINIVLLISISAVYLSIPTSLYGLIVAAAVAYIVLGPVIFLGPLLPFRDGMLERKSNLMREVAQRLRIELQKIRSKLGAGDITKHDEELIDRLRKLGKVIDELPVWPFDVGTLRRFLSAYVIPLLATITYALASDVIKIIISE